MSSWQEEVAAAHAEVIADIKAKWAELNGGPSMMESMKAFSAAIDWTEWWIIGLLSFHALLFITTIASRRNKNIQATIFFASMALIYNAERLNALALHHWASFSRQNYFEGNGLFFSAMVSAPLLLTMFAILIIYLLDACGLLIDMKKKELQYNARQRQRQEKQGAGTQKKTD